MEKAAEARFWDRYIQLARQEEVPEKALRWYVRRVEQNGNAWGQITVFANIALRNP